MGGAGNGKRTHTRCPTRLTVRIEPRAMIGSNLDTCRRAPLVIKLMGYELREDAVRGGGSRKCHTHIHTHSVSRDALGVWRLGQ